jgi:hypothetical protein
MTIMADSCVLRLPLGFEDFQNGKVLKSQCVQ